MDLNLESEGSIPGVSAADGARISWHSHRQPSHSTLANIDAIFEEGLAISENETMLFALGQVVEQRDKHTAGHCERMAFISVAMGTAMGLDRPELLALYRGGYLHDIGKVGIPDSILFKPAKLTALEWVVMRSHPERGAEICRHLKSLAPVLPLIRHHHERWDGSGYPDGLRGNEIPLLARVLQTVDIYDALTNPRPYKGGLFFRQSSAHHAGRNRSRLARPRNCEALLHAAR
jgi:putative nucleotidyltransferase with HDIG domain